MREILVVGVILFLTTSVESGAEQLLGNNAKVDSQLIDVMLENVKTKLAIIKNISIDRLLPPKQQQQQQQPSSASTLLIPKINNRAKVSTISQEPYMAPPQSISSLNKNNQDYLMCDILLNDAQLDHMIGGADNSTRKKRKAAVDFTFPNTLWPGGVIPYTFDPSLSAAAISAIDQAIAFYHANTALIFELNGNGSNQIQFINGSGCWSYVGRQYEEAQQQVSIGTGCEYFSIASHELMHGLGFWHEQQRYDRDAYVSIVTSNIDPNNLYNFDTYGPNQISTFNIPYEYGSNMHYGASDFALNSNQPTIITADPNYQNTLGVNYFPSFLDILFINTLYGFTNNCLSSSLTCQNGGYPDPINCARCRCPSGFSGITCNQLQSPTYGNASCNGTILNGTSANQTFIGFASDTSLSGASTNIYDCYYQIKCPIGNVIRIQIQSIGTYWCGPGCYYGSLEMKIGSDFRLTGFRLCCNADVGQTFVSETNLAVLIGYSRYLSFTFKIQYQCVPIVTNSSTTTIAPVNTTQLPCSQCGSLNITSTNIAGNRNGQYAVRYASNLAGCKTADMTCINPAFNYSSSIIGYNTSNDGQITLAYTLDQMTNPLYSTVEFVCNANGQYVYYGITFQSITCNIASNSPNISNSNFAITPAIPSSTTTTTTTTTQPCNTCSIESLDFEPPTNASTTNIVYYEPLITNSTNTSTGCTTIQLNCNLNNTGKFDIVYADNSHWNGSAQHSPSLQCNGTDQQWYDHHRNSIPAIGFNCYRDCNSCNITALNFTALTQIKNYAYFAPQVIYAKDATSGCASISLACNATNAGAGYEIWYAHGAGGGGGYYSYTFANTGALPTFTCNASNLQWQNNYLSKIYNLNYALTATNFICYQFAWG